MKLYEVHGLKHQYKLDKVQVPALRGVTLEIQKGEFLAISGPSGSGKTTLLNLLGLLEQPSEGAILFEGTDISHLDETAANRLRRDRLGFIFQTFNLIPVLTAYENVEYFLAKTMRSRKEIHKRVIEALDLVGILGQKDQKPNSMSGGQRQRVAIARAIAREGNVVLADEPTAALDHATGLTVIELMKKLNADRGVTFIFSTHDPKILSQAQRVIQLEDGVVVS